MVGPYITTSCRNAPFKSSALFVGINNVQSCEVDLLGTTSQSDMVYNVQSCEVVGIPTIYSDMDWLPVLMMVERITKYNHAKW